MKISLKQKLALLTSLALNFIGITSQKTRDGETVAILELSEPLKSVRGSQEVELNGKRYPITATDVTEIKVHEGDFNDDFVWDDQTDTGSYNGSDLILDVAKSGQVWLRKQSFAAAGNEMRTTFRNERLQKLVGAQIDKKAENKAAAPNPVDTTPVGAGTKKA